jgi:hypothetical protein
LFGILVLIAIIVVVIILAIPPNTSNAASSLRNSTETIYLTSDSEQTEYDSFRSKITSSSRVSYYKAELDDIETLSTSLQQVLAFYNDYFIFSESNGTLSANYKTIKNGLDGASQTQQKMAEIIKDGNSLDGQYSSTYLQSVMIDFRNEFISFLGQYQNAIGGLNKVYQGSLGDTTENNLASTIILNTINDYIAVIKSGFDKIAEIDQKGTIDSSSYSENYLPSGNIARLANFVTKYVSKTSNRAEIKNYYFQSSLITKYEKINSFFSLYNQTNFQNVIESNLKLAFNDVTDSTDVYGYVKSFLEAK